MPDRPPDPAEGEPSPYALPSEYGPAHSPRPDDELDHDDSPAVTLHDRDAEIVAGAAGAAPAAAPAAPSPSGPAAVPSAVPASDAAPTTADAAAPPDAPAAPLSRRELREQRERERAAAKRGKAPKAQRSKRSKWIRRGIAIAVVLLLIPVAVDYVDYLNRPGSDTISVRTVEWIRDNGGNGIVNTIERWWYTNNPPPTGGKPSAIKTQKTVVDTTGKSATTPSRRVASSPASPRSTPRTCAPTRCTPPTTRV